MEWAAITAFILGLFRIFKPHLLVMVANNCKQIQEVRIKTKTGETIISKIKSNNARNNHQDLNSEQDLISR